MPRKRNPAKRNLGLAREQGDERAELAREQGFEKAEPAREQGFRKAGFSLLCSLATTRFRLACHGPGFSLRRLVSERRGFFGSAVWPNGMEGGCSGLCAFTWAGGIDTVCHVSAVCNGMPPSIPFGRKGCSLPRKSRGNRKRYTLSRKRRLAKRNLGLAREQGDEKAGLAREQGVEKAGPAREQGDGKGGLSLLCSLATTRFRLAGYLPGFSLGQLGSERRSFARKGGEAKRNGGWGGRSV